MGAIFHWAENMAAEISSMRRNRMESLARLRAQTENRLQDARNILKGAREIPVGFKRERLETARRERENRRIAVSEIFSNCRDMMQKFRTERHEMAQELHSNFRSLRGQLQGLKTDLAKARAVWEELSRKS